MKNGELQKELKKHPDDLQVWLPVWNGHVETYGVADFVYNPRYLAIQNDFFGTPGRTDSRCFSEFKGKTDEKLENTDVLLIGSNFGSIPNKDIDCGDDDINTPIKELNGPDGDPDLVWHMNGFEETSPGVFTHTWVDEDHNAGLVLYNTKREWLEVCNDKGRLEFHGHLTGIEDIRRVLEVCKVPFQLWT